MAKKATSDQQKAPKGYVPALKKAYKEEIAGKLVEQFSYNTIMEAPRLLKITINEGVGDATQDKKLVEDAAEELSLITGQKAVITISRKDISNFKLRKGMPVGCKVTLRGTRMYEFLDKLVSISLPRVRDFRGVSKNAFDGHGNYTLGVKEQLIFPEIDYDKVSKIRGMDIVIVTTANTDEEAYALLEMIGMPFKK